MNYTIGPWKVTRWSKSPDIHVSAEVSPGIMHFVANCGNPEATSLPHNADAEANARLIAAAPELLDELKATNALCVQMAVVILNKAVADYIPFGLADQVETWLRTYGAAITKAEGK